MSKILSKNNSNNNNLFNNLQYYNLFNNSLNHSRILHIMLIVQKKIAIIHKIKIIIFFHKIKIIIISTITECNQHKTVKTQYYHSIILD